MPSLKEIVRAPGVTLRNAIRGIVDTQPVWYTPFQWSDSEGLYASDRQAWLYRQLPATVLRSKAALAEVLARLGEQLGSRDVQLLLHTWEHVAGPSKALPSPLAAFQAASAKFLVPTRSAVIGVALRAGPAAAAGMVAEMDTFVDKVLGEDVPDFAAYDADRIMVTAALDSVGASVLDREPGSYLESWYTLGIPTDTQAIERDRQVHIGESMVEFATAGPLTGELTSSVMPTAGDRGATVLSVRGTLTVAPGRRGAPVQGVLMRTSVIYGRRAAAPVVPLEVALNDLPNVSGRPLPLRQLAALHETLPCSPKRLAPTHQRVGADQLHGFGFADPAAPGAETGLYLGLGGETMARPVYINPHAGDGLIIALGGPESGKTFMCEALTTQAHLGGYRTLYVAGTHDSGTGFSNLTGTPTWTPSQGGELDPFRWLPHADALRLHFEYLAALTGDLSDDERVALQAAFNRAAQVGVNDIGTVLKLSDSPAAVAKVMRAIRRTPAAGLVIAGGPTTPGCLPENGRISLAEISSDKLTTQQVLASLIGHAAGTSPTPTVIGVDGFPDLLSDGMERALRQAGTAPKVGVLVTSRDATRIPGRLTSASHRVVLSTPQRDAVSLVTPNVTDALMDWLAGTGVLIQGGVVEMPSAGLYRNPEGTTSGFRMGPWPDKAAAALTRGEAHSFRRN